MAGHGVLFGLALILQLPVVVASTATLLCFGVTTWRLCNFAVDLIFLRPKASLATNQNQTMSLSPADYSNHRRSKRRPRILLGITGSVAAVKGPELASKLAREGNDVCVLLTRGGENFWTKAGEYDPQSWEEFNKCMAGEETCGCIDEGGGAAAAALSSSTMVPRGKIMVHTAEDEWEGWNRLGDPVLHIDLRDWADMLVVAPLSAHTLAKFATGLSDDTLSCCIRAWDFGHGKRPGKPVVLAPAMNTAMWEHPLTKSQLDTVKSFWNVEKGSANGVTIVEPQSKKLACGEIGTGALASVSDILAAAKQAMERARIQRKERIRSSLVAFAKKTFNQQNVGIEEVATCTNGDSNCQPEILAPISPSQFDLIETVLPKLGLTSDSLLVDLGCGDGRWIIAAADKYRCKCIGYDIDEERLGIASKAISGNNLADNVTVKRQDIFEAVERDDALADADVIVVYLFRDAMKRLSKALRDGVGNDKVKRDATVVSVGFHLPSFVPVWESNSNGIGVYIYKLEGR